MLIGANSSISSLSLEYAFESADSSDEEESEDKVRDTLVPVPRILAGLGASSSTCAWNPVIFFVAVGGCWGGGDTGPVEKGDAVTTGLAVGSGAAGRLIGSWVDLKIISERDSPEAEKLRI